MFDVRVIEDTKARHGGRLTTFQLIYPRIVHQELLTHRVFSRNAGSSRAVPVAKAVELAITEMVEPIRWGKNQPGMQAAMEDLEGADLARAQAIWRHMAEVCAAGAKELAEIGLHKQWANRPIEWFSNIRVVLTSTEWDNWFELRNHPDAQPEIKHLAELMLAAMEASEPDLCGSNEDDAFNWHLPYITAAERHTHRFEPFFLAEISSARCARTSYLTHDGANPDPVKDRGLFDRLVGSRPLHASPTEHQGYPLAERNVWCKNFRGFHQFRFDVEEVIFNPANNEGY
jgi:hypothetical protein